MTLPPIIYARGDEALDYKAGPWLDHPEPGLTPFVPLAKVAALLEAGQAVMDRWNTPNWKEAAPTADVIRQLGSALATSDQNAALSRLLREVENKAYERAANVAGDAAVAALLRNEPDASPLRQQSTRQAVAKPVRSLITPAGAESTGEGK